MDGNDTHKFDIDKRNRITAAFETISTYFSRRKKERYPTPRPIRLKVDTLSTRKFVQLLYDLQIQCDFRDSRIGTGDPRIRDSHLQSKLMTLDASTYMKLVSDVLQNFTRRKFDKLVTSYHSSKALQQLSKKYCKLSVENEQLKQRQLELELAVREKRNNEAMGSRMEVEMYKGKKFIDKFEAPKAGIPYSHVIRIIKYLNDLNTHLVARKKEWDIEGIFKTMAAINDSFRNMILYLNVAVYKKQIFLLRLAISHMITTTRFFLSNSKKLPLLTATSAIADVNFKMCILVNHAGLKLTDIDKELIQKYSKNIDINESDHSDSRTEVNIETEHSLHSKPSLSFSAIIDFADGESKNSTPLKEKRSIPKIDITNSHKTPVPKDPAEHVKKDNIPKEASIIKNAEQHKLPKKGTADNNQNNIIPQNTQHKKQASKSIHGDGKPIPQKLFIDQQPAIPTIPTITVHSTDDQEFELRPEATKKVEPSVLNQMKNANDLEKRIDDLDLNDPPISLNDTAKSPRIEKIPPLSVNDKSSNLLNETPKDMDSASDSMDNNYEVEKQKFKEKIKKFGSSPGLGLRILSESKQQPPTVGNEKAIVDDIRNMASEVGKQNKLNLKSDLSSRASLHPMLKKFVAYEDEFWKTSPMLPFNDVNSDRRVSRVDIQSIGYLVNVLEPMKEKYELAFRKLLDNMKSNKSTRGSIRRESNIITTLVAEILDKTMQVLNNEDNWDVLKQFSDHLETLDSINNGLVNFARLNLNGKISVETDDAEYAAHSFKQRINETLYKMSSSIKDLVKGLKHWENEDTAS